MAARMNSSRAPERPRSRMRLGLGRWLRRELKRGCCLPLAQERQQHGSPIRKFERIVMGGQHLLVNLSKDGRLVVDRFRFPPE